MLYDLIFAAIIITSVWLGWRKGAAKTLLSFCAVVVALVLSFSMSQFVSQFIYNTFIKDSLEAKIGDFLIESPVGGLVFEAAAFMSSLPVLVLNSLESFGITTLTLENACAQGASGIDSQLASESVAQTIAPVITGIISLVVNIILFVVFYFILRLIANGLSKVFRLPLVRFPDSLLGSVLGAAKGLVISVALALLISLLLPVIPDSWGFISEETLNKSIMYSFVNNGGLSSFVQYITYKIG